MQLAWCKKIGCLKAKGHFTQTYSPPPPPPNKELKQFNGLHLVAVFGLCVNNKFFSLAPKCKKKKGEGGWKLVWSEVKSKGNKSQDSPPHWRRRRQRHVCFTQQLMGGCSRPGWPYPQKGWVWGSSCCFSNYKEKRHQEKLRTSFLNCL